MARNKRRKPKFTQATLPLSERKRAHIDGGKTVQRYDPGKNPGRPSTANLLKRGGVFRPQQRGG